MMDHLREDVLRHLIYQGAASTKEIAWTNNYRSDDVYEKLQELLAEEVVGNYLFEDVENGPDFDPDCDVMMEGSDAGEYLCSRCCTVHNQSEAYLCAIWAVRGHMITRLLVAEITINQ